MEPVEVDGRSLAVERKQIIVGFLRDGRGGFAHVHPAGRIVRRKMRLPLFPHDFLEVPPRQRAHLVQGPLQQRRVHRVVQGDLIAADHLIGAVIIHDALKNGALRLVQSVHPALSAR